MTSSQHLYEVRPRKDKRGVDLISDALPFGRLWYGEPNAISNAIGYAMHRSRLADAVIRVYEPRRRSRGRPRRWTDLQIPESYRHAFDCVKKLHTPKAMMRMIHRKITMRAMVYFFQVGTGSSCPILLTLSSVSRPFPATVTTQS
jgi:hypothetical protein